jgi:hypothetical protein
MDNYVHPKNKHTPLRLDLFHLKELQLLTYSSPLLVLHKTSPHCPLQEHEGVRYKTFLQTYLLIYLNEQMSTLANAIVELLPVVYDPRKQVT